VQLTLGIIALAVKSTGLEVERKPRDPANPHAKTIAGFLAHGPLMSSLESKKAPPLDLANSLDSMYSVDDATTTTTVVASPFVAASPRSVVEGFRESGPGYCQDGNSGQELSSLHANGQSMEQCARVALSDPKSIAFDFTEGDGGCDIRFPAGVLAKREEGFDWWGWGGGTMNPVGSGQNKHDLPTRCFVKIVKPTEPPTTVTWTDPRPFTPEEVASRVESGRGRFSIVLPCASEAQFMVNTVKSFCDRTPENVLHEIIVVDDGSEPPLFSLLLDVDQRCKLRVLRHRDTMGLMIAKQTGGDAATGEFIGFFDCHVAPNRIWHQEMIDVLRGGPRRMAVPTITDLDLDTWDERVQSQVNSKCYIDFNAQFMWFEDESDFIPVISGGLVALTRSWWQESAGFDSKMRGWGGENVDQSLRTWLCGGEIIRAKSSRIAHMWRVPADSRTTAHYRHVGGVDNIGRVAASWFDKFSNKYRDGVLLGANPPDVSNVIPLKQKLGCKPYAYFLHRFRKVYKQGGVLPDKVFRIRSASSGTCMVRMGQNYGMTDCTRASWFHLANQDPKKGHRCCSGIREWNAMECFDKLDHEGVHPYYCDITGRNDNQHYFFTDDGRLSHPYSGQCISVSGSGQMTVSSCGVAATWERIESKIPSETETYEAEVQRLGLDESIPDN